MAINCGIVGLPNVGKSTLFNALTQAGIESANFPFCTIEPNTGVVPVPDPRLDRLAGIVKPQKVIPTTVEFVDIAGLVAGASKGEGLGNKFLANIRETDAILHVVRCFDDSNIVHVDGRVDPISDIETINTELALADLDTLEKAILRTTKKTRAGDKDAIKHLAVLELIKEPLESGRPVRSLDLTEDQRASLKSLHFLTAKPTLYIANVDEVLGGENAHLQAVLDYAAQESASVVPICAKIEEEIVELDESERALFLEDLGMEEPGLHRVIRASYGLLGLHTYFTAGEREVRAWQIPLRASAPQAAGIIHTDFEKGFIRAEVVAYDDYVGLGGEGPAKDAGKWRLEGKDYTVQDGDVIHFRFNV